MKLFEIIKATELDLPFIAEVYNYYIENSTATFHTQPASINYLRSAIPIEHDLYETFLIKTNNEKCGFCYLGNFKPRQAYDRTAEISVYLMPIAQGQGLGKEVLDYLERKAMEKGFKNLLGVITAENKSSIKLFEKKGYVRVGHLKNIGEKFGRILDVVTYQKEI